jgi:C-terminal processing protease CtpA/Prc
VISPEVEVYLEEAYTILYENSIRREVIDWDRFRERYDDRIAAVQPESLDDAHIVVQDAVHWLGDNHSVFLPPDEVTEWTNDHRISASRFEARLVDGKYGYINVPSFSSGSDESNNDFATQLQAVIAELEQDRPCGWIIDLRGNGGGNMWPMVTGVGPILGEGVFGANIRADGGTIEWRYADGQGWWGEELLAQTTNPPIELHEQQPPAAILLGRGTASAGEAVAIAFKGRPDTRFFGSNTSGFTTSPEPYYLSDGAIIFLSDSYMGDRNGTAYKFHVSPDEEVHLTDDFEAPTAWLAEQAQCQ